MARLKANRRIALTEKPFANQIFSFGRDHGYYGRILSQAVISAPTLVVQRRPRDPRVLLHAAGRQLARVVDQRGPLAHGAGSGTARPSAWPCWTGSSSGRSSRLPVRSGRARDPADSVRPARYTGAMAWADVPALRVHADPVGAVPEVPQELRPSDGARRAAGDGRRDSRTDRPRAVSQGDSAPVPRDPRRPGRRGRARRPALEPRQRGLDRRLGRRRPSPTPEPWSFDLTGRWQGRSQTTIPGNPPRPALREVFIETDRSGAIVAAGAVLTDPGRGGAGAGYLTVPDGSRRVREIASAVAASPPGRRVVARLHSAAALDAAPGPRCGGRSRARRRRPEEATYLLLESVEPDYLVQAGVNASGFLSYLFWPPAITRPGAAKTCSRRSSTPSTTARSGASAASCGTSRAPPTS